MGRALRDAILKAEDLKIEVVDMRPFGWGCEVVMRGLTGLARDEFEEGCFTGRGADRAENFTNMRARAVSMSLHDAAGDRQFTTAEDVLALGGKSAAALDHLFTVFQRLNGVGKADVEALVKN